MGHLRSKQKKSFRVKVFLRFEEVPLLRFGGDPAFDVLIFSTWTILLLLPWPPIKTVFFCHQNGHYHLKWKQWNLLCKSCLLDKSLVALKDCPRTLGRFWLEHWGVHGCRGGDRRSWSNLNSSRAEKSRQLVWDYLVPLLATDSSSRSTDWSRKWEDNKLRWIWLHFEILQKDNFRDFVLQFRGYHSTLSKNWLSHNKNCFGENERI